MFKKIMQAYYTWKHRGGLDIVMHEKDAKNNYVLGFKLFGGEYTPKNQKTNNAVKIMEIIDQKQLGICVLVSGTNGKQCDEQVLLDYQWVGAYLYSQGKITERGTSLTAFQDILRKVGIPKRGYPIDNTLSFTNFVSNKILTQQRLDNAGVFKIESYYETSDLNKVLEELDNGRTGHAGSTWYSGYNPSQLTDSCIVTPYSGYVVGGHATLIVDYDLNYYGNKVLKVLNSYGSWRPYYYVKFEDFNKVFDFGVIFNTDIPKNILGWLSMYNGSLVKELNGPKIYLIEADKKRHIPDEAIWQMLSIALSKPNAIDDTENMLPLVKEGIEVNFDEIPPWAKETAKRMAGWSSNPEWVKGIFKKYFPDLGN